MPPYSLLEILVTVYSEVNSSLTNQMPHGRWIDSTNRRSIINRLFMNPLITTAGMKEIDRRAVIEFNLPVTTLMENAGRAVADTLAATFGNVVDMRVLILCGHGNNGGDGFVVARLLAERGAKPVCCLLGHVADLKDAVAASAARVGHPGIHEITTLQRLTELVAGCSLVVDALFGTGLDRAPVGLAAAAIDLINNSGARIVSVDVPSGINASTGAVPGNAVRAELTVTMGLSKTGLWLYPGRAHAGRIVVADIGLPPVLIESAADAYLLDKQYAFSSLPVRSEDGHKGTFGKTLLVCGSREYSGAACLAARGALLSGTGLVKVAFPRSIDAVISNQVLEAVKLPLPETQTGTISIAALDMILEAAAEAQVVAIGPGLRVTPETRRLVLKLLTEVDKPVVLDADGINCLAEEQWSWAQRAAPTVLTPHPGEMARLLLTNPETVNADRIGAARSYAQMGCTVVLKGASTVISDPDGQVFINPTGNSGLGSGGTGDVLTGLIAGLIAQGAAPTHAATVAVFLHGLAADFAAQDLSEYCLSASDVLAYLPKAFVSVLSAVHN